MKSSMIIRPAALEPMVISKKTFGFLGIFKFNIILVKYILIRALVPSQQP